MKKALYWIEQHTMAGYVGYTEFEGTRTEANSLAKAMSKPGETWRPKFKRYLTGVDDES